MNDFSVQIKTIQEEAGSVVVKVAGPANISNVSVLLMQMLDAFEQAEKVTVDLSEVTEIDVTGLQLFCSSHRSSVFINKSFRLTGQDRPVIWDAAMASGKLRTTGCPTEKRHDTCIWAGRP